MSEAGRALTTQAYYWVVQRRDGAGLATTSHDRPQEKWGTYFESVPAFQLERLTLNDGIVGSSLELAGSMSSNALSTEDLKAGRWSGATFSLRVGDWASEADQNPLCQGELGKVRSGADGFTADLNLEPRRLREQPCPQTSPECRAQLGDRQCQVSLRSLQKRCRVVAVNGFDISIDEMDTDRFLFGEVRWLSGANAGLGGTVIEASAGTFRLREVPANTVGIGDALQITEGCDRRLETCASRFSNVANFRGEPHLPGTDLLMRYPGE